MDNAQQPTYPSQIQPIHVHLQRLLPHFGRIASWPFIWCVLSPTHFTQVALMPRAVDTYSDLLVCSLAIWTLTHALNFTVYPLIRHSQ